MREYSKFIFTALLFLSAFTCKSQISGVISGYYGQKMALVEVAQSLSGSYDTLEVTRISPKGSFSFSTKLKSGFYYLKIEFRYVPYYHDPACEGRIALEAPENPDNKTDYIDVQYLCSGSGQKYLHDYIETWGNKRADFIEKNPTHRADTAYNQKLRLFEKSVYDEFASGLKNHPYLKTTIDYQFAALKALAHFKSETLFEQYLKGKAVQANHGDYLNFFVQFYENKVLQHIRKNKDRYIDSLITTNQFMPVANFFAEHDFVDSREKAELLLITMNYTESLPNLKSERRELLFNRALKEAQTPVVKRIARDYLRAELTLARGTNAPPFTGVDTLGNEITQEFLKGSFTYIHFWASWNDASVNELLTISNFTEEYPEIKFLSINIDRNIEEFQRFMENNEVRHTVIHTSEFKVLDRYSAKSIPLYFLTDKHGKLLLSPAKEPRRMIKIFDALKKMSGPSRKPFEIIREYDDE